MRSLLLALVSALCLTGSANAQVDPAPLYFVNQTVYLNHYGFDPATPTASVSKFNPSLGTLVWVEFEVDAFHEQTSMSNNYDCNAGAVAWFGNDVAAANDCPATSLLRLQVPSSVFLNDHAATYPLVYFEMAEWAQEDATQQLTQFVTSYDVVTRLRHSADWSGMVGSSGSWTLTGHHTGTIGFGDEAYDTDGSCYSEISKDWSVPSALGPCHENLLMSALDNVYAIVHVKYAYTTP